MKLADPKPVYCSACFSQQPLKDHIDFEVAWDGPVINHTDNIRIPIDDLYICEDCMLQAFNTLRIAKGKTTVRI
jgi:hypothetical protein